jgi:hypothetical protein
MGNRMDTQSGAGYSDNMKQRPRYWYYQYYNIQNTGNTSIVNITILVIPVLQHCTILEIPVL